MSLSTLRCPHCGHEETLPMPDDACVYFHQCGGCQTVLKPLPGDCCVFCSYGTEPCPPRAADPGANGAGASCC